jgi:hypothetical protein
MPTELPFEISAAASERLANAVAVPNLEIGIVRDLNFKVLSPEGELTDAFEGEHYSISHDGREAWSERLAVQVRIAGREFWVAPDALEHLKGKTLTLMRRYEGPKQAGKVQSVLIVS